MSIRVGGMLVITGLGLALALGSLFVIAGLMIAVCGGLVAAVGMESVLTREGLDARATPSRSTRITAKPPPR